MSDNIERSNTNEIVCPHCDYEFYDSYESVPNNSDGEVPWEEDCPECEKKFNVSFDCRNIDDGFTSHVLICKDGEHKREVRDKFYKSEFEGSISPHSRIEVCTVCNDWEFIPVKDDGFDFAKKEIEDFRLKKRLEKRDKKYFDFDGVKVGVFKFRNDTDINLTLNEPEGNIKIWVALCRWMKSKGFQQQPLLDYLRRETVGFKRDWLECEVSFHNYAIDVKFYQNEIMSGRKKGDGRYESNKYELLNNTMKLQLRASMNMVKKYFVSNGFEFEDKKNDLQRLLSKLKVEKLEDWTDPEKIYNRDNEDRDKSIMKSGDLKYFYDGKILKNGIIWWNNGNQWYVMCNGTLEQTSHYRLFDYQGEPKRKPLSKDEQIQRLHTELTRAEKDHNYGRCKVLWGKLESYKLYNVWSLKHESWWGKNNGGYTPDKTLAGVYTHENIMNKQSYYNDGVDSKAILIK